MVSDSWGSKTFAHLDRQGAYDVILGILATLADEADCSLLVRDYSRLHLFSRSHCVKYSKS